MGRGTQLFEFLNAKKMPNKTQIQHHYTGISVTDDLKRFRRKWNIEKRRLQKNIDNDNK